MDTLFLESCELKNNEALYYGGAINIDTIQ